MQGPASNCSESRRLQRLLGRLWQELRGAGAGPAGSSNASWASRARPPPRAAAAAADDAYLYILLIMIFYGCLAGGLILAYTRSSRGKGDAKQDPFHLYIERDWPADAPRPERSSSGDSEPC